MADVFKEYEGVFPKSLISRSREALTGKFSESKAKSIAKAISEEYEEMKVMPGESVGLVAAESIGEPGTQMSVDYNERVLVKTKKGVKSFLIGKFIDGVFANYGWKMLDNAEQTEVFELPKEADFCVASIGNDEKLSWQRVTAVSRHEAPSTLLKLTTRSGRTITATPYHSFVIRQDNRIVPVPGSRLKVGDRIPSIRKLPAVELSCALSMEEFLPKEKYVYTSELRKAIKDKSRLHRSAVVPLGYEQIHNYSKNQVLLQQDSVHLVQHHGSAQVPEFLPLDASFGFLVGAYLAEGAHTTNYVSITNVCDAYLSNAAAFAEKYGIGCKIRSGVGEYGRSVALNIHSTLLADFVEKTCGKKSSGKKVPEFAYSAPDEFVSKLLQAYFDGDGSVSVTRNVIRASSNSRELIDGIALLLSRFGIFSSKSSDAKGQRWLSVSYRHARLFSEKVGFSIPSKRDALAKLAVNLDGAGATSYDIIDMVPGYGELFSRLGSKLGLPSRLVTRLSRKQKVGRTTLLEYSSLFASVAEKKGVDVSAELKVIRQALDSDVLWDEIVNAESVAPSSPFVYDFSVGGTETFATFDGIVTHNTLNTFHFAGVAEMNITMGLPRIIEVLDGRKNLATPMMDIYLNKPYSQGQDIKKIALSIKETTLKEVASEISINLADSRIEVVVDKAKLSEIGMSEEGLHSALKSELKGLSIDLRKDFISFKAKNKEAEVNEVFKLKEKIKSAVIKGIKEISQVLPVKRDNEFIIITAGSNLKKVLALPFVDETRTTCNDIFEIESVLGIEAARQAIISEVYKVIENQGLNVDIRHLMLVADTMCSSGKVQGITRYGTVKEKASVLARASFETPIKHLIEASLYGETDYLKSIVENVMLNQPVPVGTGMLQLVTKPEEKKAK